MKTFLSTCSIILVSALFSALNTQAQSGAFTVTGAGYSTAVVTDYQCIGINPANLGWKRNNHLMNFGIGEADFTIYSEPLKRELVNNLFDASGKFSSAERQEAVKNFTDSKLQFNGNISGFGLSFQDEKIGGFGISVRERMMWDSNLNEQSADLVFNGYNANYFDIVEVDQYGDSVGVALDPEKVSELFEGTKLDMLWYREFNFSYGRSIINKENISLYGGIGFKYIQGYSVFNYSYTSDGIIKAYSALNPLFNVDYDTDSPSKIRDTDYQAIGKGWGMDFGLSAMLFKNIRIGIAITDIGQIKWDGNVYEGEDANLNKIKTTGLDNYNIFELDDNLAFNNLKWGGWEGLQNKTTKLPMSIRVGGAYILNTKFEFGTEFYIPGNEVPGSYDKLIFGIGTRIMPAKWFRGSIGVVSGGKTGTDIPVGISFFPFNNQSFSWEMGLAVRDITTYFRQDKPTVSLAIGFLRFSFGNLGRTAKSEATDN